ncbi:MAG: STAS domain-containing protein [Helicobacteraceae bacterium]|nr:STAS domain-containing protein [Helicobacteraceae bacterium]
MKLENEKFTVYEVENIKEAFLNELNQSDSITVDLENVKEIDISAIQLLLSLKRSCIEDEKSFEIINLKQEALRVVQLSGCTSELGE